MPRRLLAFAAYALCLSPRLAPAAAQVLPAGAGPPTARADPIPLATEPLDLNTASAGELRALPGMGEVYARRVMEGRPYTAKNQLLTRGVLPQAAYEAIREHIVAHRPPRRP